MPSKRVKGIGQASGVDDLTNRSPALVGLFSKQIEFMQLSEIRGEHSQVRDIETVLNRPPFPLPPLKCLPRGIVTSILECMPLLVMKEKDAVVCVGNIRLYRLANYALDPNQNSGLSAPPNVAGKPAETTSNLTEGLPAVLRLQQLVSICIASATARYFRTDRVGRLFVASRINLARILGRFPWRRIEPVLCHEPLLTPLDHWIVEAADSSRGKARRDMMGRTAANTLSTL